MLNRRNGPEQVMQLVEERAPDGYKVVTDVLSLKELEDIAANYKRVAGFQVEGLNAKPPIVQLGRSASGSRLAVRADAFALLDQPRAGRGGREHGAVFGHQLALDEGDRLAELRHLASPMIGPGFAGARKFTVMLMVAV